MDYIGGILVFVTCLLFFSKMSLPILTHTLQEAEKQIDRERDEERFLDIKKPF